MFTHIAWKNSIDKKDFKIFRKCTFFTSNATFKLEIFMKRLCTVEADKATKVIKMNVSIFFCKFTVCIRTNIVKQNFEHLKTSLIYFRTTSINLWHKNVGVIIHHIVLAHIYNCYNF